MKRRTGFTLCAIVVSLFIVPVQLCRAEYTGQTNNISSHMYTVGSYSHSCYLSGYFDVAVSATVDWNALTISYDSMSIDCSGWTGTFADDFTISPGETGTITTHLAIEPLYIETFDVGPLALTPSTGGQYLIENPSPAGFQEFTITGSYEVLGPTESQTGAISTVVTVDTSRTFPRYTLDTTGYPFEISLEPDCDDICTNPFPLIDVVVNNVPIEISSISQSLFVTGPITLVPEPATLSLLGLGALILRKKRRS